MDVFVALCLLICTTQLEAASRDKQCYKAKTCVHNNNEKCGLSGTGAPRRFLDTCDIFEFNCLQGADFTKAPMVNCKDLKSLYKINQKWENEDNQINVKNPQESANVQDINQEYDNGHEGNSQHGGIDQVEYPQDPNEQGENNAGESNLPHDENGVRDYTQDGIQETFVPQDGNAEETFSQDGIEERDPHQYGNEESNDPQYGNENPQDGAAQSENIQESYKATPVKLIATLQPS